MSRPHHVFLIPGMFGFAKLAGYDYFEHLERGFSERFAAAGIPLRLTIVPAPPTASLTVRARVLAQRLAETAGGDGRSDDDDAVIHLVGHSTGGLDARLLVSPANQLDLPPSAQAWQRRIRSIVSVNCPHYGTPLAGYFTSVAGVRLLYALSLLTVTSLSVGKLPLTAFSGLLAAVGGIDQKLGLELKLLDQLTEQLLRVVGDRGRRDIQDYLEHVRFDRGGIMHLMPEVAELFNAIVPDHPDVRYGCVASAAPGPGPRRLLRGLRSPWAAASLAVYSTVYGVASYADVRYPYAHPDAQQARLLDAAFPEGVRSETVDGIVPTLSMLWRELLWCGFADHLDIVGHFADKSLPERHVDWLASGARFGGRDFGRMLDAICQFLQRDRS